MVKCDTWDAAGLDDWEVGGLSTAGDEPKEAVSAVADIAEAGKGSDSARGGTVNGGGGGGLVK